MVNIEQLIEEGRTLFTSLDREPGLTVSGAFWTHIREPEQPRLRFLIKELPTLGPTKLYGKIQRLLKKVPLNSFTLEDVAVIDEDDPDVRSLRSVTGRSVVLNQVFSALPNTGGATAYVYRLEPEIKRKRTQRAH
jgi:hypothetical protein